MIQASGRASSAGLNMCDTNYPAVVKMQSPDGNVWPTWLCTLGAAYECGGK